MARELGEALLDAADTLDKSLDVYNEIHLDMFGDEVVALPMNYTAEAPVMIVTGSPTKSSLSNNDSKPTKPDSHLSVVDK
jgi:hypothetical protein